MTKIAITTAYTARRVNRSTFLIIHNDKYDEMPFIYVKLYDKPAIAVVIDTGCGAAAAANPNAHLTDLVDFIETFPVDENGHQPLNPRAKKEDHGFVGEREYLIICSHVHFDHIGGMESFHPSRSRVFASAYDRDFLSCANREKNSLCPTVGMRLPRYHIAHLVADFERLEGSGSCQVDLGLSCIHTPGHTPDSLSLWDEKERWLYTGDAFYYRDGLVSGDVPILQPIVFPPQGNLREYLNSLSKLSKHVESANQRETEAGVESNILIGCGHTTVGARAEDIFLDVRKFFEAVIDERVPVKYRQELYGETYTLWEEEGSPLFSLFAPERLFLEYRNGQRFA